MFKETENTPQSSINKRINIYMSESDWQRLKRLANMARVSRSAYIRVLIQQAWEHQTGEKARLI